MSSLIKKISLSAALVLSFAAYALSQTLGQNKAAGPAFPAPRQPVLPSPAKPAKQAGQAKPASIGVYRDGSYIGSVADAYYGYVQVEVTVSGEKIAGVQFLRYPNDRATSLEINSQAMPYLKEEAVQSQSADVDIVSGATQTSYAFRESLASALAQAKN